MEKVPPTELVEFLSRYSPHVGELFLSARQMVFEVAPDATEIITNASYTVACGFTFSHSIKHTFLYLGAYSKHVNFGFAFGASMLDPEAKLIGDGKVMRHVSCLTGESVHDDYLRYLVDQAVQMAFRPSEALSPMTVITKMKKSAPSA